MARRTGVFLKEGVILFGFLNGLWLAIGVNPGAELFEVFEGIILGLTSAGPVVFALTILPLALAALMFVLIFKRGGWLGLVAVAVAFVSGLWLLANPSVAFFMLLGALGLGFVATR